MRRWWRVGGSKWGKQGEGVSGSCRHLFVRQSSQKCTGVLCSDLYIRVRQAAAHITTPPTDFSSTQNWRDEVIKLVSGYQAVRKIYIVSYSVRDILGGDFSPCCTVPQSLCQSSLHQCLSCQPTERRVKLSSLRATLDWQTSAGLGWVWVSDIMRLHCLLCLLWSMSRFAKHLGS